MKKKLLITVTCCVFFIPVFCLGQSADTGRANKSEINTGLENNGDASWAINNLVAPSSPGAALIGISPDVIQRPTDPAAFSVSLLNATGNLTMIPSSYAVDFAPAWLFGGEHISFPDFQSNDVGKNIWQSFDVSLAYKNVKDSISNNTNTTVGIGFKVSILRGTINSKAIKLVDQTYDIVSKLLSLEITERTNYSNTHPEYLKWNKEMHTYSDSVKKIVQARLQHIRDSLNNVVIAKSAFARSALDSVKKAGESVDFTRYGWKLDFAGGMSYYFPNQAYSGGGLYNAGAWLTGGYEDEPSKVSFLAITRYLYNPKQAYADPNDILRQTDLSTFDMGIRLLVGTKSSKFNFGGELVYRSVL
ncbi:MAG: hypothetical protein ACREGF_02900, partial [Candidatus Saccharimonadales bacterium]